MSDNPAPSANRGLMGTDADPSGHGVKNRVQESPDEDTPKQDVETGAKGGAAGASPGPQDQPFRDTVEMQSRAQQMEGTGQADTPANEATRTAPGDNLAE